MELFARLKVDNIYKSKDYTDKKSGEVTAGKWKVQTFEEVKTEEGVQKKLLDISIPEELARDLNKKIGQTVEIPVATFINGKKVGYYGI